MAGWYVRRDEKVVGPIESAKLKELAAAGKLLPTDQIAKDAAGPWKVVSRTSLYSGSQPEPQFRSSVAPSAPVSESLPNDNRLAPSVQPQLPSNANRQKATRLRLWMPVSIGATILVCVGLVIFAYKQMSKPRTSPVVLPTTYTLEIGMLEDRQPSRNTPVYLISNSGTPFIESEIARYNDERTKRLDEIADRIKQLDYAKESLIRPRERYENSLRDNILVGSAELLYKDAQQRLALEQRLTEIAVDSFNEWHNRFSKTFPQILESSTAKVARTDMNGNVKFENVASGSVMLIAVPVDTQTFDFQVLTLDSSTAHPMIVEFDKNPLIPTTK